LLSGTGSYRAEGIVLKDPHDHNALASALENMADSARRESFASAARLAGKRWTFEDHYRGLMAILTAHVTGRTAAPQVATMQA
jgi:hypothetical protein